MDRTTGRNGRQWAEHGAESKQQRMSRGPRTVKAEAEAQAREEGRWQVRGEGVEQTPELKAKAG